MLLRVAVLCILIFLPIDRIVGQVSNSARSSTPVVAPKSLEPLRLPPGTIVILGDANGDTIRRIDGILIAPEKFTELLDQIDTLKKQLAARKPIVPSRCRVTGSIVSDGKRSLAKLEAVFECVTDQARTIVFLGCSRAKAISAELGDGSLPTLLSSDDSLSVLLEKPGPHTIRVMLEAPVLSRGKRDEAGFDLGLPGAPITSLSLRSPAKVSALQVGVRTTDSLNPAKPLEVRRFDTKLLDPANPEPVPLGAVELLDVSWSEPRATTPAAVPGEAQSSASIEVETRVEETEVRTTARLRLRGQVREWKLFAPHLADITVERASFVGGIGPLVTASELPIDQAPTVTRPADPQKPPIWTIRFKEILPTDLLVTIQVRQPRPRSPDPKASGPFAVGPFGVKDVFPQPASFKIGAPPQLRVNYRLSGDARRRDTGSEDGNTETTFQYATIPTNERGEPTTAVELRVEPVPGALATSSAHALTLVDGGWRLRSTLKIRPIRQEVSGVEIAVPKGLVNFEASPPELVEGVREGRDLGPWGRTSLVKLASPRRTEFELILEGFYQTPRTAPANILDLPRLVGSEERPGMPSGKIADRAGQVTVQVPEGVDLFGVVREWEGDRIGSWAHPLEEIGRTGGGPAYAEMSRRPGFSVTVPRTPAQVELRRQERRSELAAELLTDLTLGDRLGTIRQTIRWRAGANLPRTLRLRTVGGVLDVRLISKGGFLESAGPNEWRLILDAAPSTEFQALLVARFALPARGLDPASGLRVPVPLLWPVGVGQTETRVRVWRESGLSVGWSASLAEGLWQEQGAEVVPDRDSLPSLVLFGSGSNLPLVLNWRDHVDAPAAVWVERTLVQAIAGESGIQAYRTRFRLRKWPGQAIDIDLGVDPGLAAAEVLLDGKKAENTRIVSGDDGVRLVRVAVPIQDGSGLIVEVRHSVPAGLRSIGVETSLLSARLRNAVHLGPTRWQVSLSGRSIPLCFGGNALIEDAWGLRNGLPSPLAAYDSVELERWFTGGLEPTPWGNGETTLTARQGLPEPLRLVVVPWGTWLIGCSSLILVVGFVLSRLRAATLWGGLLILGTILLTSALVRPQPTRHFLAGALPGSVALLLILSLSAIVRRRHLRRMRALPGFARSPGGSARMNNGVVRANREPSTVDVPASPDSWAVADKGA